MRLFPNEFFLKVERDLMKCGICGSATEQGYTTSVTDLGSCLVIVRNVPCCKCTECTEVMYTADVVQRLEKILEDASCLMAEISIIDYGKAACAGKEGN